ncbi:ERG4_1 [Sanghuangporus vaninii]
MGAQSELRQRKPTAANGFTPSEVGRKRDERLDKHEHYEFGGPWGVVAMMVGFPILMYYLWVCLWFYDGKLVYPSSLDDVQPFLERMWDHVRTEASPNAYAWKVYSVFSSSSSL